MKTREEREDDATEIAEQLRKEREATRLAHRGTEPPHKITGTYVYVDKGGQL